MDLTSEHPFWSLKNGLVNSYPPLTSDLQCDVTVLGAGITGAMLAYSLSKAGFAVVVLDKRDVCSGSTSASTALLQYEIDVPLIEMGGLIGKEQAQLAYQLSHQSIDSLEALAWELGNPCDFERRTSLYFADDKRSAITLANEYRARRELKLDIAYHDAASCRTKFGLQGYALLSSTQAACCDPYLFAHALLMGAEGFGSKIHDRTHVVSIEHSANQCTLKTRKGPVVHCDRVVVAAGYEATQMLPERVLDLSNTYAYVSQPLNSTQTSDWNREWMLWETKHPYLYLRMTKDNRMLIGGEDDDFHNPVRRDRALSRKTKSIQQKAEKLLARGPFEPEYAWAGTFGKTKDGLAYIGEHPDLPNRYFALGFGGNGITFSSIACNMILKLLRGEDCPEQHLFRFRR
jgi:glycine/D-amino acid oxidase-like deaminating enzyme